MAILEPPLRINDRCPVQWRDDPNEYLDAVVVHRRHCNHRKRQRSKKSTNAVELEDHELDACPADELEYYVHYVNHDRRLDEWVLLDKFRLDGLQRFSQETNTTNPSNTNNNNNNNTHNSSNTNQEATESSQPNNSTSPVEEGRSRRRTTATHTSNGDHDETDEPAEPDDPTSITNNPNSSQRDLLSGGNFHHGEDPTLEREHEEATKVKNIETIVIGPWQVESWYYSPFPTAYCDLEILYVCEYCLTYMKKYKTYQHHQCKWRHPPGQEIYRHQDVAVYEIDGKEHRVYCQKLCLLAKLFLDHKTLYFETSPFLFYVVTKVDAQGAHLVGYFSKEKNSSEGYNLACILTFPQYQKCGFGKFIISLSYELTKREQKTGSPEKPLSDLGKVSYRSYWTHILMTYLAQHNVAHEDTNIHNISIDTGIRTEDLISTLQHLEMIKVWKGQHVIYVKQSMIRDYMKKDKKMLLCNPDYLKWEPPAIASAPKET